MYFATLEPESGRLLSLRMTPMQVRHFRENRVSRHDTEWLCGVLRRECSRFGVRVLLEGEGTFSLQWD
jgi:poly-gamma-glutamate capsule biosynthesis protein CapA/YwtB (metallophosphatase superfamily)